MFGVIGSQSISVGTNLLSDALAKKITAFQNREAVRCLTETLHTWEAQFEQASDGKISRCKKSGGTVKNYAQIREPLI